MLGAHIRRVIGQLLYMLQSQGVFRMWLGQRSQEGMVRTSTSFACAVACISEEMEDWQPLAVIATVDETLSYLSAHTHSWSAILTRMRGPKLSRRAQYCAGKVPPSTTTITLMDSCIVASVRLVKGLQ